MIKYDHFVCNNANEVTNDLERYNIQPDQIISITAKVTDAHTYKYDYTGSMDIYINTPQYVVFYWYEEDEE